MIAVFLEASRQERCGRLGISVLFIVTASSAELRRKAPPDSEAKLAFYRTRSGFDRLTTSGAAGKGLFDCPQRSAAS